MKASSEKIVKLMIISSFITSLVLMVISLFIKDMPTKEAYIYENNEIVTYSWHNYFESVTNIIMMLVLLVLTIATVIFIFNKIKRKEKIVKKLLLVWIISFISTIMVFLSCVMVNGAWIKDDYNPRCYKYTDGKHAIVIEEKSFLLYGGATIYQIKKDNVAVIIGEISTDDGGRNKGDYEIKWNDDHAEILYDTFVTSNSLETEIVKFE